MSTCCDDYECFEQTCMCLAVRIVSHLLPVLLSLADRNCCRADDACLGQCPTNEELNSQTVMQGAMPTSKNACPKPLSIINAAIAQCQPAFIAVLHNMWLLNTISGPGRNEMLHQPDNNCTTLSLNAHPRTLNFMTASLLASCHQSVLVR